MPWLPKTLARGLVVSEADVGAFKLRKGSNGSVLAVRCVIQLCCGAIGGNRPQVVIRRARKTRRAAGLHILYRDSVVRRLTPQPARADTKVAQRLPRSPPLP